MVWGVMIGIFFKGGSSAQKRLCWRVVCFVARKRLRWRVVYFVVRKRLRWRVVYIVAQKRLRWGVVCFVARRDYLKWVAGVALCAIPTLDTHRGDAHSLCVTPALPPRKNLSIFPSLNLFFRSKVNGERVLHPLHSLHPCNAVMPVML